MFLFLHSDYNKDMTNYQTGNHETNDSQLSSIPVPIGHIFNTMGLNSVEIGDPTKRAEMTEKIAASFQDGNVE
jgi:hypothetical protein